jgi:hypothetical protein
MFLLFSIYVGEASFNKLRSFPGLTQPKQHFRFIVDSAGSSQKNVTAYPEKINWGLLLLAFLTITAG